MLRRLFVVPACLFLAASVLSQVPTKPSAQSTKLPKPPGNCTVSGRVVSAAEGSPLRSARVGLVEANAPKHPTVYATTTDSDGHFEIKQVLAGRYTFFAAKIGFLEQHYQSKNPDDEGATLSLTSGQTVDDAMFRLVRAGVITGKVVDDTGEPMMGVSISVLHKPTDEEREDDGPRRKKIEMTSVSAGVTDDRGEYRVYKLKPGEYYVKATETGESFYFGPGSLMADRQLLEELGTEFAPIYYPGVQQRDQAQPITVGAGQETQADFAMRKVKLVEVAGKVIGPAGGSGSRTYVQLSQAGVEDWGAEMGGMTDASGDFAIKGVGPGSYFISASMRDKDKFYATRQRIEVGETKIDSVILMLGVGATIRGRIRTANGAALPSNRIQIHLQATGDGGPFGFGFTDVNKDGSFELAGVTDGDYLLGTSLIAEGWFVESAHLGSEDVYVDGIQVENGAVKGTLDIVVSNESAQIEGVVTDSDKGGPLVGVSVKARFDPETPYSRYPRSATTDQNGHYLLKDVPPGKYRVTAKMGAAAAGAAAVKSEAVPVTLNERDHKVMDFKLKLPQSE